VTIKQICSRKKEENMLNRLLVGHGGEAKKVSKKCGSFRKCLNTDNKLEQKFLKPALIYIYVTSSRVRLKHFLVGRHSSIHSAVCLTTGPKPLPKRAVHIARSRTSSFKKEYLLLSLRSSSSFLRLLPCLPLSYIPPFIFSSITRFRRQFLRKM
jgi:hypothetical protein